MKFVKFEIAAIDGGEVLVNIEKIKALVKQDNTTSYVVLDSTLSYLVNGNLETIQNLLK